MFNYEEMPIHWANRLSFLTRKLLGVRFNSIGDGISPEEWAILLVLWKKGPHTPSELAEVTFKDRTTVTRLIDTMVRKNIVHRVEDTSDRRRSVVQLLPEGTALQTALMPLALDIIQEMQAGISTEDIEITQRTLQTMTMNLLRISSSSSPQKRNDKNGQL